MKPLKWTRFWTEFFGEFFAVSFVGAVAEDDAFEGLLHAGEGLDQNVHSFAADDLAGVDDEVAVAEIAPNGGVARTGDGGMNFDAFAGETVFEEFVAHESGDDAHAVEGAVNFDFANFVAVTDEFYWEGAGVIAGDAGAAAEDAKGRSGAGANFSGEDAVFITAHAVDVVVVDHARDRDPGGGDSFEDVEVGRFVNEEGVGLEGVDLMIEFARVEWLAEFENFIPAGFVFAGGRAVEDADFMAAGGEFGSGDVHVCFRAGEGSEAFVDVEDIHPR
jgi:hypothetical protein